MSRSSTPDTQIWRPGLEDSDTTGAQIVRPKSTDTQETQLYRPHSALQPRVRRRLSDESFQSTGSSFDLDEDVAQHWEIKHSWRARMAERYRTQPPTPKAPIRRKSTDTFTLDDDDDWQEALRPHEFTRAISKPPTETELRRRSSIESFQTTGSFRLDPDVASEWEMKNGWRFHNQGPEPKPAPNFSRPLRVPQSVVDHEPAQRKDAWPLPPSDEIRPVTQPTNGPGSSSSGSAAASTSSKSILRNGNSAPHHSQQTSLHSVTTTSSIASQRQAPNPSQQEQSKLQSADPTKPQLTITSALRPANKKHVSFETPKPSLPPLRQKPSTDTSRSASTAGSTNSTSTGTHSAAASINGQSSAASVTTQAAMESWKASNFDTSALSAKEIAKLKKKGVDPALYLEMKAATKGQKGKLRGAPLVGNSFIG